MFSKILLDWYTENGRQLPWRNTENAYYIWLSEIILQQTRIEQGRSYYSHFVTEYPTILDLAKASEQQVLKSWQGLGYYSRARNLHAAARYVVEELGGRFPDTYEGILSLKGVGRYTAAAIASFAYKLPYPVIDGNVYRFIARMYGIDTPIGTDQAYREFEQLLSRLIDRERPDLFNQAIMDFGSLYCKPTGCDCYGCVFRQDCVAFNKGKVDLLPVKAKKTAVKDRYFYYVDIRWNDHLVLRKREAGDIWQGLYELPLVETDKPIAQRWLLGRMRKQLLSWVGEAPAQLEIGPEMVHQLTHRTIKAQFFRANYQEKPHLMDEKMRIVDMDELKTLPISRLIDRYLSKL
ncbi:MAG: A/G-specific adenine glycosylase [Bacteroidales bacterium]|nr:A/G-specific adenine glycosylase [Candidatus Colimorpha merdihippi]